MQKYSLRSLSAPSEVVNHPVFYQLPTSYTSLINALAMSELERKIPPEPKLNAAVYE